jgi:hypothetical protein
MNNAIDDIHKYDGQLYKPKQFYENNNYDKKELLSEFIKTIDIKDPELKLYAIRGLEIIKNDIDTKSNFVTSDNIYAEDILIGIFLLTKKYIIDPEILTTTYINIGEQMKHMFQTNGFCPIGRSRCIQIYIYLKDYIDKNHYQN